MRHVRGFTLIEVLTVVALISLMAALSFVSLSGRRDEEMLKASARELGAVVRTAQNNALTGLRTGVPEGRSLCQYGVEWVSNSSYRSFVQYSRSDGSCPGNANDVQYFGTYTVNAGVLFSDSGWRTAFSVPRGGLIGGLSYYRIGLQRNSKTLSVCVSGSGSVTQTAIGSASCP